MDEVYKKMPNASSLYNWIAVTMIRMCRWGCWSLRIRCNAFCLLLCICSISLFPAFPGLASSALFPSCWRTPSFRVRFAASRSDMNFAPLFNFWYCQSPSFLIFFEFPWHRTQWFCFRLQRDTASAFVGFRLQLYHLPRVSIWPGFKQAFSWRRGC